MSFLTLGTAPEGPCRAVQGLQGYRSRLPCLGYRSVQRTRKLPSAARNFPHHAASIGLPRLSQKLCLGLQCRAVPQSFEPHVDPNVLYAQLLVLTATVGAAGYWWWTLVPTLRRSLAKEKRQGAVKEYLLDLQQNDQHKVERWFYTDWLNQLQNRQAMAQRAAAKRAAVLGDPRQQQEQQQQDEGVDTKRSEPAVLLVDAAETKLQHQLRQQGDEPILPVSEKQHEESDKQPYFWSLDNPIVATGAGLAVVALLSTILHRT